LYGVNQKTASNSRTVRSHNSGKRTCGLGGDFIPVAPRKRNLYACSHHGH
jgi:hypothetical protein